MADNPEFPDCNTCMMIDKHQKLWLFWPIILDNHWESALTNYRTSNDYTGPGCPKWDWQGVIWLKPADFKDKAMSLLQRERWPSGRSRTRSGSKATSTSWKSDLGDKLSQRLGWQPRCKPTVLSTGRILLPLYSDTYSFSLMAISDDDGPDLVRQRAVDRLWQHSARRARAQGRLARGLHARERPARQDPRQRIERQGTDLGTGRRARPARTPARASTPCGWPTAIGC